MTSPEDFASAAMMRLVAMGLGAQGISVPMQPPSGAHVPRASKRDLLAHVLEAHGPTAILAIADAAPHMPPEPIVEALRRASDVEDLLNRWARLETFSHKRHRVKPNRVGDGVYALRHVAIDDGPPPSIAESLLVFGLLTILCEGLGAQDVALSDADGRALRLKGQWHDVPLHDTPSKVTLTARAAAIQATVAARQANDIDTLRRIIADDPIRRWSLKSLAQQVGTSERTLQRRLAARSSGFSRLLTEARLQVAATHLCTAGGPELAEIGFLSGFSDQSHFTRSFKTEVGTTPGRYRIGFQESRR